MTDECRTCKTPIEGHLKVGFHLCEIHTEIDGRGVCLTRCGRWFWHDDGNARQLEEGEDYKGCAGCTHY